MKKKIVMMAVILALCAFVSVPAVAGTLLASYEPGESEPTVGGNNTNDCVVTPVLASSVGLTAPHGSYILEVVINAADGKVEFDHTWATGTYDLAGETELSFDVYVSTSATLPAITGIWDPHWSPPDTWCPTSNLPVVGEWTTLTCDVSGYEQTGLNDIWAMIFEAMPNGAAGTNYVDFLRLGDYATTTATDPTPCDTCGVPITVTELSWTNPPSEGTLTCDVWLSTDPNTLLWTSADLLEDDLSVTPEAIATATIAPALIDNKTYYWRVDMTDSITGETIGKLWSFNTFNLPPVVDAGLKQNVWLKSDSATVALNGSATDDGLPDPPDAMEFEWTYESDPAGKTVVFGDASEAVTTATFTEAGTYTLTLTADDGLYTEPPTVNAEEGDDTVVVEVYAEGTADDYLVALWDFEGDALDGIGGHHGTLVGATYVDANDVMVGTGSVLFRADGRVDIEDSGVSDPNYNTWADFTDEVSITAWMKVPEFTLDWQYVVDKGAAYGIQREGTSNGVMFRISQSPDDEQAARGSLDLTEVGSNDGWHHIAGTFDGNNARLYVDGWLEAEVDASVYENAIPRDGGFLSLGGFEGRMDHVRIYDVGLSGQVVLDQYIADGGGSSCGQVYEPTDLDQDCYTGLADLAVLAVDWLECSDITNSICN